MTSTAPHDRSTLAGVAWGLALTAAVAVVLAPLAIQAGAVSPFLGFRVFGGALLASLLTLALALVALFVSRRSPAGRRVAIRAVLLSGALVLLLGVLATPASDVPPIHDVTTDPADPPGFLVSDGVPENAGEPGDYPAANAAIQREAYPDLQPIRVEAPPDQAYARAVDAARSLGWELVREEPARGTFEATDTSRIFRFVDDVVVRMRPDAAGSRIDLRSRSRVGQSDLGANAARIRAFGDALGAGAP